MSIERGRRPPRCARASAPCERALSLTCGVARAVHIAAAFVELRATWVNSTPHDATCVLNIPMSAARLPTSPSTSSLPVYQYSKCCSEAWGRKYGC